MQTKSLLFALPSFLLVLSPLAAGTPTPTSGSENTLAKRTPGPEPHFDEVLGPHSHNGIVNPNEQGYYEYNGPSGVQNNGYDLRDDYKDDHWLAKRSEIWDDVVGTRDEGGVLEKRDLIYGSNLVKRQLPQDQDVGFDQSNDNEGEAGGMMEMGEELDGPQPQGDNYDKSSAAGLLAKMKKSIPEIPKDLPTLAKSKGYPKKLQKMLNDLHKAIDQLRPTLEMYLGGRVSARNGLNPLGTNLSTDKTFLQNAQTLKNKFKAHGAKKKAHNGGGKAAKNNVSAISKGYVPDKLD